MNIKKLKTHTHIDEALLKSCEQQDSKSVELLYEACFHFLIPLCKRYYKNEDDARSAYNMGFLKIIKNIKDIQRESSAFIPWARRIMTNTLIDEYRKNKKYHENISKRDNERELDFHSDTCQNRGDDTMGYQFLMQQLEKLKPATKQVFILYVIEGYNHREIADLLDMSEGTSKWHLSTARKELQYHIEQQHSFLVQKKQAI